MTLRIAAMLALVLSSHTAGAASLAIATLDFTSPFGLPALHFAGSGVTGVSTAAGATVDAGSGFAGATDFAISLSPATHVDIEVLSHASGNFGVGATTVTMPIRGLIVFSGFGGTPLNVSPIEIGIPYDQVVNEGGVSVRVQAVPWAITFDDRTLDGVGVISASSALFVTTSLSSFPIPYNATLRLTYVPEPGTLLLLSAGLGAVAVLKKRRTA